MKDYNHRFHTSDVNAEKQGEEMGQSHKQLSL
jgi:hypothetical protein